MKTNIRKFPAVLLLAVLCLTVFPISAMAAGVAEVKIPVSVELSGEKPSPDETYTIILQGEDEAPMPEENTITITGAGKAEFPAVEYRILVMSGNHAGWRHSWRSQSDRSVSG